MSDQQQPIDEQIREALVLTLIGSLDKITQAIVAKVGEIDVVALMEAQRQQQADYRQQAVFDSYKSNMDATRQALLQSVANGLTQKGRGYVEQRETE